MTKRRSKVAGYFYPGQRERLLEEVDRFLDVKATPRKATVAIMPHAGYVYSGKTAGMVAASVEVPNRVVLMGPKHRWGGADAALSTADAWEFPFGLVPVDTSLVGELADDTDLILDDAAHAEEHSLEVEVPFLWRRNSDLAIVPVALGVQSKADLETIGNQLAQVIERQEGPVLIVASTDMSHQLPIDEANRLDHLAIDKILALDPEGLFDVVRDNRISMCGVIPVTAALFAAKSLGATSAELVNYTTSAEASGDTASVVGYAGVVVS